VLAAAGADTATAIDPRDERADPRQVDVIVGVDVGLVGRAERVIAMRTGGKRCQWRRVVQIRTNTHVPLASATSLTVAAEAGRGATADGMASVMIGTKQGGAGPFVLASTGVIS